MAPQREQTIRAVSPGASQARDAADSHLDPTDGSNRFYDSGSALLLGVIALLTAVHWQLYPVFVDSYYHMEVIHGFRQAGGIVTHAFWEMAPGGRTHIYSPGLHAAGYLAALLGLAPSAFITLVSWACYPACLLTTWLWLRRVAGPRAALFALILLSSPLAFLYNQAAHTASAAAMAVIPLALWAHAAQKYRLGGTLTFLAIAIHPLGLILPPALTLNTLLSRQRMWAGLLTATAPVVLFFPWLAHMWAAREVLPERFVSGGLSLGGHGLNLGLLLLASAALGVPGALARRGSRLTVLATVLSCGVVFLLGLGGRFLMFNIHWPLACLGGVGLAELTGRLERRPALRPAARVLSLGIAFAALTVFPTLLIPLGPAGAPGAGVPRGHVAGPHDAPGRPLVPHPGPGNGGPLAGGNGAFANPPAGRHPGMPVSIQPAVLPTLLNPNARITPGPGPEGGQGAGAVDLIHEPGVKEFLRAVSAEVAEGDVIFVPDPPMAALITGVTGRWTSDGILPGVKPAASPAKPADCDFVARRRPARDVPPELGEFTEPPFGLPGPPDPFAVFLWGPLQHGSVSPAPPGFDQVFENEFGSLWRNTVQPQHNREPVQPVVPLSLILGIVAAGMTLAVFDFLPRRS